MPGGKLPSLCLVDTADDLGGLREEVLELGRTRRVNGYAWSDVVQALGFTTVRDFKGNEDLHLRVHLSDRSALERVTSTYNNS